MQIKPELPVFKIRCSSIGKIMGGVFSKPTEKQMAELEKLQQKEKRTALQEERLLELIEKRDAKPTLQVGAKTFLQQWALEQIYGRQQEFSNKYTEKGIQCEAEAIELFNELRGVKAKKNTERRENNWITGEPDLVGSGEIADIKNSWSVFTFPLFDTKIPESDYYYQLQGYMALFDKPKASVNYCLIDAPESLIDAAALMQSRKIGSSEVDADLYEEVRAKMTYGDIPKELKLKRFEFERNDNVIAAIHNQVELCREYLDTLTYEMMITTVKIEPVE